MDKEILSTIQYLAWLLGYIEDKDERKQILNTIETLAKQVKIQSPTTKVVKDNKGN